MDAAEWDRLAARAEAPPVEQAVDVLRTLLAGMPQVRLAVLFGSAARGTAGEASDLDIGVSLMGGEESTFASLSVALERATKCRVDLVSLDTSPPLLRFEIARDGILLIERGEHAWVDFRSKAMVDWWDWAPTARMAHRVMVERLEEEARRGST